MNTMYVYNVDTNEIIAKIIAGDNDACEKIAEDRGWLQDDLGWTYSEFGLITTDETETVEA